MEYQIKAIAEKKAQPEKSHKAVNRNATGPITVILAETNVQETLPDAKTARKWLRTKGFSVVMATKEGSTWTVHPTEGGGTDD